MASQQEIEQRLNDLTNTVNSIISGAKKLPDLEVASSSDNNSFYVRDSSDGKSKQLPSAEVTSNIVTKYYDSTAATLTAMVAELNALNPPLEITANEIYRFRLSTGEVYELKDKGKGIYGSGNLQVVEADFVKIKGLIEFSDKPTFYKFGIEYDFTDKSTFETPFKYNFINDGVRIYCKGTIKILGSNPNGGGFSNILQFDSLDDSVAGRKLTIVIYYEDYSNGQFTFNIMLQETIEQQSFRQWVWSTLPQTSPSDNTFDFNLVVNVQDLEGEDANFFGIVNGINYSYNNLNGQIINPTDELAQFGFFDGAWLFNNFQKRTYINFQSNFPGWYILNKLQYGVDEKEETIYFKDVAGIVTTALGYEFSVNQSAEETTGSFVIQEQAGTLFKFSDDSFKQELPTIIEVENEKVRNIKSFITANGLIFENLNFKFVRKSLRKLWGEEFLQSPNLKAVFLPEINDFVQTGEPTSITGALFNILNPNNKFTLSRTTVKYRHRESLLIEEVGISQVAVDYLNGFPELIVEPQRTNLVKNSEPTAHENAASDLTSYIGINNPFGLASYVKLDKTETAAFRYAGQITDNNWYQHQYYFFTDGFNLDFRTQATTADLNYNINTRGNTGSEKIAYKIKDRDISFGHRKTTVNTFSNGFTNNDNNGLIHRSVQINLQDIIFSGIGLYPANKNSFEGSYIRTTGAAKTVDADVYTITNLVSDGLVSATEGTIIERGSNQEVRTVWTGGNKLKFIDNVLVSTVEEVPNDNAFTLDTSSYRLSEVLIFDIAILPN